MMNNSTLSYHIQHNADQTALSYLEDVWVEKDAKEHRCFTIEFVGGRNFFFPFFLSFLSDLTVAECIVPLEYSISKKTNFSRIKF